MNTSKFDLWGMLRKCEIPLDLPTLAEISPLCRKELYQRLVRRRSRVARKTKETEPTIQIVDMLMDSEAPSIIVDIGDHSVIAVQLDGGVALRLMTKQTMQDLGLTNIEPTTIVLCVADQRQVKPLGMLQNIKTIIAGLEFHVSYLVVQPHTSRASFPTLMGCPWLLQA